MQEQLHKSTPDKLTSLYNTKVNLKLWQGKAKKRNIGDHENNN